MSNIYTLKVVKNGITIQRKQIATGLRKGAIPLTLKADADLTYVLQDESGAKPLPKIKTRFVGSDLYVVIDVADEESTHLLLQNYADVQASSVLATPGKYGELVIFRTDSTTALSGGDKALATWVAPGIDDGSALSLSSPVVWAGGGLLVATLASSGSSSSTDTSTSATALGKINSYINASGTVAVSAPVLKDYTDAGITGVIDNAMAAAVSSVLKPLGTATVASAQSVVDAYLKVWNKANGTAADTATNDSTSADYQMLGLTTVPSGNGITLLNDIVKTRLTTDVDTLAKLNAFASIANRIILAAADNTVTLTAGEFNSLGLVDITAANASALLSAIVASANDGLGVSTVAQLKDISAAYLKILAQANGVRGDTTEVSKIPTFAEFKVVGVTMGKAGDSSSAQSGAALKLLNDVIDGLATTAVDTVKEMSDLAVVVDKVLNLSIAAGGAGAGAAVGLTVSDLVLLGVSGVTTDNLAQVVEAIRLTQSTNGAALDTVKKLQVAADFGVIMNYADTAPGAVAHIAPSLAQYQNVGLLTTDSGTNKAITTANKSAVDSAVEALSAADVSTTARLQALVNTYSKVFSAANSIKADTLDAAKLTAVDAQTLGALSNYDAQTGAIGGSTSGKALGSGVQQGAALKLFNDVIDGRSIGQVDTVVELNQLNIVIDKVLDLSRGVTPAVALTAAEFTLIGVTGVTSGTNGNLAKVTASISATRSDTAHGSDGTLVDTLVELQAIASLAVVQSYSNESASALTIPNALTYSVDLGFTDISNNSNLANAVNSSLVVKHNGNISLAEVRQLALDFQSILNEATSGTINTNLDPSAAQYANVLGNTSHVFHVTTLNSPTALQGNALGLLNDVVRHKSQTGVDSVLELEAIATVVDNVMKTAAGAAGNNVLFGELINILGMANTNQFSDYNNSTKTTALNNAIRNTVDSGEGVQTWDQLQFILNAAILG